MKIEFAPRTFKITRATIILIAVVLAAYVAYAAVNLTVNNTATVTVSTGANLFLAPGQTSTTVCSGTSGTYSESPQISWGNVAQLSTQDQYACLQNTGTTHTLLVSTTFSSTYGTLSIYSGGTGTTSLNGASIPSNGFILVHLNWAVSSTAPTGATTFNVNIS
jgi:hypothetical protein